MSIDVMEKQLASRTVLKNDKIPYSVRKKELEEKLMEKEAEDRKGGKENLDENSYRFMGEDNLSNIIKPDKELKRYDSDVSFGLGETGVVNDNIKRNLKMLEQKDKKDPQTGQGQQTTTRTMLNTENMDIILNRLLQGKEVEEIKVKSDKNFNINLEGKVSMSQLLLRAEVLAKLHIMNQREDSQQMLQPQYDRLNKINTMMKEATQH